MTASYLYLDSPDFINSLDFDYLETYSFQRGSNYAETINNLIPEYNRLKVRKEKRDNLSQQDNSRLTKLDQLLGYTQFLFDSDGQLHFSAIKTSTFKSDNPISNTLISILQTPVINVPDWMCAPVYRDAIVFYNTTNTIAAALNICFSCQYIQTYADTYINTDSTAYPLLKQFFTEIGHPVE